MMSQRRSSRIKEREERRIKKTHSTSSSSSGSDEESIEGRELLAVVNTPSSKNKITPQKANNFTKV